MNTFQYKDFEGSVEVSVDDRCLHGKLLFVNDLITYQGRDVEELEQSFRAAVDDYIAFCSQVGKDPEKPYKGSFNVRVKPEIHKALVVRAQRDKVSLNELVCRAFDTYLADVCVAHTYHHHHHVVMSQDRPAKWWHVASVPDSERLIDATMADQRSQFEFHITEATQLWTGLVPGHQSLS